MTETYQVHVTKDYLVFSAAHFITYGGDNCERLHGHNYRVQAEAEGPLDENHYVIDFIVLRDALARDRGAAGSSCSAAVHASADQSDC